MSENDSFDQFLRNICLLGSAEMPVFRPTLTVEMIHEFARLMNAYETPVDVDEFNPLAQGYARPLEELVQSVLDYEGLEDELLDAALARDGGVGGE